VPRELQPISAGNRSDESALYQRDQHNRPTLAARRAGTAMTLVLTKQPSDRKEATTGFTGFYFVGTQVTSGLDAGE